MAVRLSQLRTNKASRKPATGIHLRQQAWHGKIDLQEVARVSKSIAEEGLPVFRPCNSQAGALDAVLIPADTCPDGRDDRLLQSSTVAVLHNQRVVTRVRAYCASKPIELCAEDQAQRRDRHNQRCIDRLHVR